MSKSKDILIVNYGFPPNPGVGGRRWAFFAKHLAKKGYKVHVLCNEYKGDLESVYVDIITDNNIQLHWLPNFYPSIVNTHPHTILDKIKYRFWDFILTNYSKGSPYDKTLFLKSRIKKTGLQLIELYNIQNVIVTGAPFRLLYYFAEIKPNISNLIIDFRDPWSWGDLYGFKDLNIKKKTFEKKMESFAIEKADVVLTPVGKMHSELEDLYPVWSSKIKLLAHGFDKENIVPREKNTKNKKKSLNLIYIGTIYDGVNNYFEEIARATKANNVDIKIAFFGSNKNNLSISNSSFTFHPPLKPKDLFIQIQKYDFCLMMYPDRIKDYISTKFYEVIYSKTPILGIGNDGKISQFIKTKKVGIHIQPSSILETFTSEFPFSTYQHEPEIDIEKYSFDQLTDQLIAFLK